MPMKCLSFSGANSHHSSAENLAYTTWKLVSAKRALFPTVLIHFLGKGHEQLPDFFFLASRNPSEPLLVVCTDSSRTSAAGMRVCFSADTALVFQTFHMLINYIFGQGAHNTSALTLSYRLPRTVLYTNKFQQLPAKSLC